MFIITYKSNNRHIYTYINIYDSDNKEKEKYQLINYKNTISFSHWEMTIASKLLYSITDLQN